MAYQMVQQILIPGVCFLFICSELTVREIRNRTSKWPAFILNKYVLTYALGIAYFTFIAFVFIEALTVVNFLMKVFQYSLLYVITAVSCVIVERKWQASFISVACIFIFPFIFSLFGFKSGITLVIIALYLIFSLIVGYLEALQYENIRLVIGWLFIACGIFLLVPVLYGKLLIGKELTVGIGINFTILGIITLTIFKKQIVGIETLDQRMNTILELEIEEPFKPPTVFYEAVEDFDKLVVLFENGIYSADEFRNAKSDWIDQLPNKIRPARTSELLVALLPYLKNDALEEDELIRIKQLS